jgi:dihydroflavonol-4-reductase
LGSESREGKNMSRVLVTGGSGFVGSHCIVQLLREGHSVRTTVRDLKREAEVQAMVRRGGADPDGKLSFVEADLERDNGWDLAIDNCDYVLHVASPFGGNRPMSEEEMIMPARDGTLRVLRAARAAGVRRVVMTSSFGAIGYGHSPRSQPFTEKDWSNVNGPDVSAYIKSKIIAERAAWDFIEREGGTLELTVINPTGIFGPILGRDYSSSIEIIRSLLKGAVPATPRLYFGLIDARDVADLHLRAMTSPKAAGERFIAVAGEPLSMFQVAQVLRGGLGKMAARVPKHEFPDFVVRLLARFSPRMREVASQLGKLRRASNEKARQLLSWEPRSNEDTILATAESLSQFGLL